MMLGLSISDKSGIRDLEDFLAKAQSSQRNNFHCVLLVSVIPDLDRESRKGKSILDSRFCGNDKSGFGER